jgi:hypothetical protein
MTIQNSYQVENAIETLKSLTDLDIHLDLNAQQSAITLNNQTFPIESKREFRLNQLQQLLDQKAQFDGLILITENLSANLRPILRENGMNYLDTAGNTYIKMPNQGVFIFIDGQKPIVKPEKNKDKAFTNSGLKVVFHLLKNQELINANQRTIAETAQVSLDTVNKTIESLRQQGFIRRVTKDTMRLDNKRKLFDKWADIYENRLKPSLFMGNFRFQNMETEKNWQNINLSASTVWGEEPAASILTDGFLRPAIFTLYTTETKNDMIRNYRFLPDAHGNIKIYHPFSDIQSSISPLWVYADMLNSGDARNFEVAEKIYNQYVQNIFE